MTPTELFGYSIVGTLGEGAGSVVYAVRHPKTGRPYAMKHVVRSDDRSVRFIEQLDNEYDIGRQVHHPLLRGVVERFVSRSMLLRVNEAALVMELFDGQTLADERPTCPAATLSIFEQTAAALAAMHAAGFVHCDLKPGNIMVNSAGQVKLIDLGQACRTGTTKARIQGTPDYIAPEQVKLQPVMPATDVYNFGATLYYTLTGQKMPTLFTLAKGGNSFLVDSHLSTPNELNPAVPVPLSNFVMECVRTNPSKRPPDMSAVLRRLAVLKELFGDARKGRPSVA